MSDSESSLLRLVKSKKAEFIGVIEHFFDKRNEVSGLYGQKLIIQFLEMLYKQISLKYESRVESY